MLPWGLNYVFDEVIFKILLACLLCGLIGLEREYRQKAAGFRTHLLVGLGSAMFTLISMHGFGAADPSRVAAQIVSGIGFIGGGAILRHGLSVRGVTTAATLWLVAAIGMSVAVGWYEPALIATAVALLTLILLTNLEAILPSLPTPIMVQLRMTIAAAQQGTLRETIDAAGWTMRRGHMEKAIDGAVRLSYTIRHTAGTTKDFEALLVQLQELEGLQDLSWEILESAS
jgi:putative Mg2+ transporter-C (MgtC) family protein